MKSEQANQLLSNVWLIHLKGKQDEQYLKYLHGVLVPFSLSNVCTVK